VHRDPGRYELRYHHSPPTLHPEDARDTVLVCIAFEGARYTFTRRTETGRDVVQRLDSRDTLVVPAEQPHTVAWKRAFSVRDPFILAAAGQLRLAFHEDGQVSPAFASAITRVLERHIDDHLDQPLTLAVWCRGRDSDSWRARTRIRFLAVVEDVTSEAVQHGSAIAGDTTFVYLGASGLNVAPRQEAQAAGIRNAGRHARESRRRHAR